MSKKCINCNNVEIYKDNIATCPKCGNYLKTFGSEIDDNFNTLDNDISKVDNDSDKSNEIKDKTNEIEEKVNKTTQNKEEYCIEGIVKNFFEQEISTFLVTKVFRSLFRGMPFVLSNTVNTFQVYGARRINSGDNRTSTEVIIYGKIARGKLPVNNVVKVWGKKDRYGSVIAKKVYNNTSQTYLKINHSVSPIIIWILFLTFIYIIYQLTQVNWDQVFADILSFIMMIIFGLVLLYFIIVFPIKSMFRKKEEE